MTGSGKIKYYKITKSIRINELQSKNWNPDYIKRLLTFTKEKQKIILFDNFLKNTNQNKLISFEVYHKLDFDYNQLLKNFENHLLDHD